MVCESSEDLSLPVLVLCFPFSFLMVLFSTSKDRGQPVTSCSHHSRGGHVGVAGDEGVITGHEGVAWGPGSLRRSRAIRWRHGSGGSGGREGGVCWRVGWLGCCCSSCKSSLPPLFTALTVIFFLHLEKVFNSLCACFTFTVCCCCTGTSFLLSCSATQ